MLQLTDYEEQYMTPTEIKKRGFQVKFSTKSIYFSNFSCMFLNPNHYFQFELQVFINLLDLKNLQEQVDAFCYGKLF